VSFNSGASNNAVPSEAGRAALQLVSSANHCGGVQFAQVSDYVASVGATLARMPCAAIEELIAVLLRASDAGRAIFVFGNGGSAALASHAACDLGKGTSDVARERVRVLSLTDNVPLITAWANDTAYELVFTEQMKNFIQPGDVAFAISGSGNSPNVLHALRYAREIGAVTVGLTGFEGGKMRALCDVCVVVPSDNMQIIEDLHVMASHGIAPPAGAGARRGGSCRGAPARDRRARLRTANRGVEPHPARERGSHVDSPQSGAHQLRRRWHRSARLLRAVRRSSVEHRDRQVLLHGPAQTR
jgi:D-sedoheptulose 7-phosphate isomerase